MFELTPGSVFGNVEEFGTEGSEDENGEEVVVCYPQKLGGCFTTYRVIRVVRGASEAYGIFGAIAYQQLQSTSLHPRVDSGSFLLAEAYVCP